MAIEIVKNDLTVKDAEFAKALSISDATESLEIHSLVDLKENRDLKNKLMF